MIRILYFSKRISVIFLCIGFVGCASVPTGFLKPDESALEKRQLQMRQYETTNEEQILTAVASVLQDLGFTLDNSETKLGFVAASKKADATDAGQIFLVALLAGSNAVGNCDASQVVKASVITKPSIDEKKIAVRVTFQRIVWNMRGQINKVESINDKEIYQKFYDSLSKSIFLEAQKI
jgi:hypothetical protein